MSTAIVAYRRPSAPVLELAAGDVACDLRLSSVDSRRKIAMYDVSLANRAPAGVSCRLYGIDADVSPREFGMLDIAAHSVVHSRFMVPFDRANRCDRLYVQIVGDGVHLLAEAQTPVDRRRGTRPAWSLAAAVLVGATAVGGATFARPAVLALGLPDTAAPGVVNVSYALRGIGNAAYSATAIDGTSLGSGTLNDVNGRFTVAVPPSAVGSRVRVAVETQGPLGHDVRDATFDVVAPARAVAVTVPAAPPAASPARVVSFSAHRERYAGRSSVLASYFAVADHGTLQVMDERGIVLGSARFTRGGTSRITLRRDVADEAIRTELTVYRGASRAESSVEIPPNSAVPAVAAVAVPAVAGALPGAESVSTARDPFGLPDHILAGREFAVAVRNVLPNMRLSLQDEIGAVIEEHDVPADAKTIPFAAPKATAADVYYLVCTYTHGETDETLVRSVRTFPR